MKSIIELAKEAGIETEWSFDFKIRLERFAAIVRAERQWVDLTDDEIEEIGKSYFDEWSFGFARAVIAADREKNK